jgi:hypothetical protein
MAVNFYLIGYWISTLTNTGEVPVSGVPEPEEFWAGNHENELEVNSTVCWVSPASE